MITYPARPQYFAHRFIRLMTKSALAMEIGSEGAWLLSIIAMQEDSCRYSKAVSFWNSQLTVLLGFRNDHEARMRRIRQRCVDAGWLNYEPGGRTHPGHYFVTIPTHLIQIEDGPCDESGFESDNETTLKRHQSDNETTLKRHQSDTFLTSTLPLPGEGEAPAPTQEKIDQKAKNREALTRAIRKQGLPASPEAVSEWADLLTGLGGCKTGEDALSGFLWLLELAKERGVQVTYAKHTRDLADRLGARMRRIYKNDETQEYTP